MNGDITQADLIAFMQDELRTRQDSYLVRVEMGRMTKAEAERGLALTRAVLAALTGEAVLPIEEQISDRYLKIEPILHQIHLCARENRAKCEGCNATAMALDETFGING